MIVGGLDDRLLIKVLSLIFHLLQAELFLFFFELLLFEIVSATLEPNRDHALQLKLLYFFNFWDISQKFPDPCLFGSLNFFLSVFDHLIEHGMKDSLIKINDAVAAARAMEELLYFFIVGFAQPLKLAGSVDHD